MPLTIETFNNIKGGNSFYKAISHPLTARKAADLIETLSKAGPIAVYDPHGFYSGFNEFYDLSDLNIVQSYVQDTARIGSDVAGHSALPITELPDTSATTLLIAAFDAQKLRDHINHLIPTKCTVYSLDDCRLDSDLLTNKRNYLDNRNFATNFAFFRDSAGARTRLATANYWSG